MTATNGQEYYQTSIEKLDDDQDEGNGFIQNDTLSLDSEEDDSAGEDVDTDGPIISEDGQTSPALRKKTKSEVNATNNTENEENEVKSTDTTITSEIGNEEKIDEFNDTDCESNVIKRAKCTATNDPALFTCVVCSYRANNKSALSAHLTKHSDERPFKCDLCGKGFKARAVLQRHQNIHLVYKPYVCSSCEMSFSRYEALLRHKRKPHDCYKCDICHARFTQSNYLKNHRLKHSANGKPGFQCLLCPTTCLRKSDLRSHIRKLHSSDPPLPCKQCGKEIRGRHLYNLHIKTHDVAKCYRCEYCPYATIYPSCLESHLFTVHMNVKQLTCGICGTNFRQLELLTRHMKSYHLPGANKELCYEETEEQQDHDKKLRADYEEIEEYSEDNIPHIYDEYETNEYEEQRKDVQCVQQSDETNEKETLIIEVKPEEIQEMDIAKASFKKSTISSKAEDKQYSEIKIEIHDDQGFMVIKAMPNDGGFDGK